MRDRPSLWPAAAILLVLAAGVAWQEWTRSWVGAPVLVAACVAAVVLVSLATHGSRRRAREWSPRPGAEDELASRPAIGPMMGPSPRFRLRTLLIAVAVAAMALSGLHLWRLSREYRRRADQYSSEHFIWEGDGAAELEARQRMSPAEWEAYMDRRYQEILRWRQHMQAKYRRAARYPWLSVPPDPPEP
jgi:peptidoglycan/LPS O-acetylase OafA/YrhL